jgi:hypothetical protein
LAVSLSTRRQKHNFSWYWRSQKTFEERVAKGVEFIQPPTAQLYGVEAMGLDNSGNWFSLVQR